MPGIDLLEDLIRSEMARKKFVESGKLYPNINPGPSQVLDFPSVAPEIHVPIGGEILPDSNVWINRFTVPSDSSNSEYIVAQHRTRRWWACSCKGFTNHQKCKHLTRLDLGVYMQPLEARVAITVSALPKVLVTEKSERNDVARPRRRFALPEEDL